MNHKLLVSGASVSYGYKLPGEKFNPKLWANQVAQKCFNIGLDEIHNISEVGVDNKKIFQNTVGAMITDEYEQVIVQWQTTNRENFNMGLELYKTEINLLGATPDPHEINLVAGIRVPTKDITKTQEFLLKYHNYHWGILDLVSYVQALSHIALSRQTKIYFVNYNQPWQDHRYFDRKIWNLPSELDKVTQEILLVDLRDDSDIALLYNKIHDDYLKYGGIQENKWFNLYQPLSNIQIDNATDNDLHPGIKSQDKFVELLTNQYETMLNNNP